MKPLSFIKIAQNYGKFTQISDYHMLAVNENAVIMFSAEPQINPSTVTWNCGANGQSQPTIVNLRGVFKKC